METVGTLAGGLAHDFNNVLVGILGTISMMDHRLRKEGIIEKEKLEEYLQIMKSSGERATAIIQQLLTLSRKQELSLAPTDLNTVIKNIMKIGENSFDKSVKLNPVNLKHPAIVNADSTQIEQVLLNLCVNAVHAMTIMRKEDENWGGELTVTINKTHSDEYLQKVHPEMEEEEYWALSVEDSGVGMDHDTLSKIFDPFFTLKDKGKGTGFGLSIVYNIIKQHQGTIDVYSKIGVGTNFCVYLPVLKEETAHGDEPELTSIHEGEGLILVVDDEEVMRKIAMEILKECGYEVITAENGRKGVEVFEKRKDEITAVLLDMSMPEMSGIEAYHHILEMDPEIRVLITSGSRQDDRIDEVLSSGVKAFIQKPFTLIELSAKMKRVIEGL
jgi:CheY-like chemotaxis protein